MHSRSIFFSCQIFEILFILEVLNVSRVLINANTDIQAKSDKNFGWLIFKRSLEYRDHL